MSDTPMDEPTQAEIARIERLYEALHSGLAKRSDAIAEIRTGIAHAHEDAVLAETGELAWKSRAEQAEAELEALREELTELRATVRDD